MKIISVFVFWMFAALVFLSGCQSDEVKNEVETEFEVEGQVFVVTKGRENIKMGLTPIHVVSDKEFQKIALELAKQIKAFRVEGIQRAANSEAKTKFIRELLAMEERGLAKPTLAALREEAADGMAEYIFKNKILVHEDLERSKFLLFSMIPAATTKTDADGRFKISVNSKGWVIAQGQRSVGEDSEDYLWIAPIGDPEKVSKSSLLISNDSGYDSTEELYALLSSVSASGSGVLPAVGSGEVDQETAQWIRDANEKAKQAIRVVDQAAEAEREARILELTTIRESLSYESLKSKGGGTVVAWGGNLYNQCDVPSGLIDAVGIAAGGRHSLALKKDGTVVAWGRNDENQCDVPSGLTEVVGIAAGGFHSLALKKDGTVVAWGDNDDNECDVPSGLTDVVGIAAVDSDSLALKVDGTVVVWGRLSSKPSDLTDAVGIAAASFHSLALKKDGTVVAWGDNDDDKCDVPSGLTDVVGIAAGGPHSLALRKDGTVVSWGRLLFEPSVLTDVVRIAASSRHTLALKKDGTVVAWGDNRGKQCDVPSGLTDVVGIATGDNFSLAIKIAKNN